MKQASIVRTVIVGFLVLLVHAGTAQAQVAGGEATEPDPEEAPVPPPAPPPSVDPASPADPVTDEADSAMVSADQGATDVADASLEDLLNTRISVGAVGTMLASETPYDLTLISGDTIRAQHYHTIPEALGFSVGLGSTHINTAQDQLSIRGSNAFQKGTIGLLINGHSHNFDIFNVTPWSALPLVFDAVERVEVVKGNVPFYGRSAVSGVVNVEMKKEAHHESARFDLKLGSYGREDYTMTYSKPIGDDASMVVAVNHASVDNSFVFNSDYKADKAAGIADECNSGDYVQNDGRNNNLQSTSAYLSLHKNTDDGSALIYFGANTTPNYALRLPDRLCKTWIASNAVYAGARYEFRNEKLNTTHELSVYGSRFDNKWIQNGTSAGSQLGPDNPVFDAYQSAGYEQPSYKRGVITGEFATVRSFPGGHVMLKPQVRFTQITQQNFFGFTDLAPSAPTGALRGRDRGTKFVEAGVNGQLAFSFLDHLTHVVDVRVDSNHKIRSTFGALVSSSYNISDQHAVRIAASFMQRPPAIEEYGPRLLLYLGSGSKAGEYINNPDLKPESAGMMDIGVLGKIGDMGNYRAGGYISLRNDVIEFAYMGEVADPMGELIPRYQFVNANNITLAGGYAETNLHFKPINVNVGVTLEKIINVDGRIAGAPDGRYGDDYLAPIRAHIMASYTLDKLRFGLQGRFVGQHTWQWPGWTDSTAVNPGDPQEKLSEKTVKAHYPIDVTLDYTSAGSTFFVKVLNVVGTKYNSWRYDKSDNYLGREVRVGVSLDL